VKNLERIHNRSYVNVMYSIVDPINETMC